jgi:type VI secretion system protein ImpL
MNTASLPGSRPLTLRSLVPFSGLAAGALLIWFTGPTLTVAGTAPLAAPMHRLALMAALALGWMLWALWRAVGTRGTAQPPATPPPTVHAPHARLLDEADTLRQRFRETEAALRRAAPLPWTVLLGGPGAGKSTLLRHAGLVPVHAEGDQAARAGGPTPDCACWLGDEGVLFDTAGRYALQDGEADRAGWAAFVHLLRRHRRRAPLNGVLVAVSAAQLQTQDEAAEARHAQALRERLRELDHAFGLRVPVFVVVTGLDRVAGFAESFAALEREQRGQAWGVAFEPAESAPAAALARGFEPLLARLNERLLARLDGERDPQVCARLFAFPHEMAQLQRDLSRFLALAFGTRRHARAPWLRGVYFTSAAQQGTPLERGQAAVARSLGLQWPTPRGGTGTDGFFVSGLLQRVWAEAALVHGDPRLRQRQRWRHAAACAAVLAATASGVALWSAAHARGQATIARIHAAAQSALDAEAQAPAGDATPSTLLPRLDALRALAETQDGRADGPARHELGLMQPAHLQDAARRAYLRELNRLLAPQLIAALADGLRQALGDPDATYTALKAYLMLGQPQHREPALLDAQLQAAWTRRLPGAPGTVTRLQAHAAALLAGGLPPPALDEALVRQAREALARQPLADRVYGRLRREAAARHDLDFVPREALAPGASAFERRSGQDLDHGIPGFFTARGYAEVFLPQSRQLAPSLRTQAWVLGTDAQGQGADELSTLGEDVARRYAADYVRAWQALLADLRPAPLRDRGQVLQGLARLSDRHSPLRALLQAVARHTTLPAAEANPSTAPAPGDPAPAIRAAFAELAAVIRPGADGRAPLDAVMERLARLYAELDVPPVLDAAAVPPPDASAAVRTLKQDALVQPQPLKAWLLQLANDAQRVDDQARQAMQQKQRAEAQKNDASLAAAAIAPIPVSTPRPAGPLAPPRPEGS